MCLSDTARNGTTSALESTMRKDQLKVSSAKSVKVYEDSVLNCFIALALGSVTSFGTTVFSLHFPFALTPEAAEAIYRPAFYSYDPLTSHFDNTAWTYGTDYVLAVIMTLLAYKSLAEKSPAQRLKVRVAGLMILYAVSVTAGGLSHQFYTTVESRNSWGFRLLWTICVGTVTAAGGMMGCCASEVARNFQGFYVPEWFWIGFGTFTTAVCAGGWISFQRPACDIFVAGVTQSPPSFYMMGIVFMKLMGRVKSRAECWKCLLAFILNAPLLPGYALILQIPSFSLAAVNTLLHCWLCVAWSMQGNSLRYVVREIAREAADSEKNKTN